jgi:transposase
LTADRGSRRKEEGVSDLVELLRRVELLEKEQSQIRDQLTATEDERNAYHELYLETLERCRKLELGLRGQASERLPSEAQLSFGVLKMMLAEDGRSDLSELEPPRTVREHERRRPTGRKPIPDHLPRVDIEILPDEVRRAGLDAFEKIGQDVREVVERRPASLVVARIIKPKFVRKDRRREEAEVLVGETPALPIPRGLAGPGLLADTLVRRWQDHQPLHRLEGIFAREGIELSRQTMCGWHMELAPLCEPLIAAMRQDAFEQPFLCVDATGVLVQALERCRTGHFWVLVAPGRHVLFEYTPKHDSDAVDTVLAGYQGYLVADAHVVYDHLYAGGEVTEVNCWAHCRRYFFKALASEPDRAKIALGLIGSLFKIERSLQTAPRKKRERLRAKHSKPIVERFFSWCDAVWPDLYEDTPIYDGVRYARNQREGLARFLRDGRLPIHNNISELNLRRQAVGRKNWIFVGSDDGGRTNAVFTSLLASCRMLGVEPWSYLRDLLCLLPDWSSHRLLELAPLNWNRTREQADVAALLAANPYRQLTLADQPTTSG